jgi:hypothetical protein
MANPDILIGLMACPYFMPVKKLENGTWPHPSRLPLGCGWSGHCTAPDHAGHEPPQHVLEAFCNLGYADACPWAPRERSADAVRFAVVAPPESGKRSKTDPAATTTLRLSFVFERDHHPAGQGELQYDLRTANWLRPHDDPRIQRMAECFLASHLQKKA